MKKYFYSIMVVLLILSCKNENSVKTLSYAQEAVGEHNNGVFTITNEEVIKAEWESQLKAESSDSSSVNLEAFEIIKGKVEDDNSEDYFMLIARSNDGYTKAAALLELKEDKFYFQNVEGSDDDIYNYTVCRGDCNEGCMPVVKYSNKTKYIICSPCIDCMKIENNMY